MKRVLVTILAILYISTSAGANVRFHFCMNELTSWQTGKPASDKCERCGMKKSRAATNGCCKDEQKFVQSNPDQKATYFPLQLIPLPITALPSAYIGHPGLGFKAVPQLTVPQPASPVPIGPALYLRNAVFRI